MKVALVHELLTMRGGAERVLRVLGDLYPDAPVYTLLYDERKLGAWFPRSRVRTSILQKQAERLSWLIGSRAFNHHLYLEHFPRAAEAWDFSGYDLVISASSAFAHGIITNGRPRHLCYVHSPARYLWDRTHDVLQRAGGGLPGLLKRRHLEPLFHTLRIWDTEAAHRPDALIAASQTVQRRIEQYWRRESAIIHPPIDDFWFETNNEQRATSNDPYFLVVSTLAPYKRIDLAIRACNLLKRRLIIAGEGPALRALKSIAGPTVEFAGYKTQEELKALYEGADATIFPGDEDFGLVPVESMACGTPVIAFRSGGALETVVEGKTGVFFDEQTPESLADAIRRVDGKKDTEACMGAAAPFRRKTFEDSIRGAVDAVMA